MRNFNLFLTHDRIVYQEFTETTKPLTTNFFPLSPATNNLIANLSQFFDQGLIPVGSRCNLILDHESIIFQSMVLPKQKREKLTQILKFELPNLLIFDLDDYHFDFTMGNPSPRENNLQIGVFLIAKTLTDEIERLFTYYKLELYHIFSLDNLLDIQHLSCPENTPNHVFLIFFQNKIKVFVYRNSFLAGISTLDYLSETLSGKEICQTVNKSLASILLQDAETNEVSLDPILSSFCDVGSEGILYPRQKDEVAEPNSITTTVLSLFPFIVSKVNNRVNLFEQNKWFFQEITKNTRTLSVGVTLIVFLAFILITKNIYSIIDKNNRLSFLDAEYQQVLQQVMEKGVSKSNAEYILKEKVLSLRENWKKEQKYAIRDYRNIQLLERISNSKKVVKSLHLDGITITEDSLVIKGKLVSFRELEIFKKEMEILTGEKSIRISQKQTSQDSVQFTLSTNLLSK